MLCKMEFAAHLVALGQFVAHMYCSFVVLISIHFFISCFPKMVFIMFGTWVLLIVSFAWALLKCCWYCFIFESMNWLQVGPTLANHRLFLTCQVNSNKFQDELLWSKIFSIVKHYYKITNNFYVFNKFPKIKMWR